MIRVRSITLARRGEAITFIRNERGEPFAKADARLRRWAAAADWPTPPVDHETIHVTLRYLDRVTVRHVYRLRRHDRHLVDLLGRSLRRQAARYAGRDRGQFDPAGYQAYLAAMGADVQRRHADYLDRYEIGTRRVVAGQLSLDDLLAEDG